MKSFFVAIVAIAAAFACTEAVLTLNEHQQAKEAAAREAVKDAPVDLPSFGPTDLNGLDKHPNLAPQSFDSIREAAVYAAQMSYDLSNQVEYGGVILRDAQGKYWVTVPYTFESDDSVIINHIDKYIGFATVGDYHTHPCMPYTHLPDYFSEPDIANILYWNETGYVTNFCNGHVYEFTAQKDTPDNTYVVAIHHTLTHGRQIGLIALTKKPIIIEPAPTFGDLLDNLKPQ